MAKHSMNMNEEVAPRVKRLLPEGKRQFQVLSCKDDVSKSGNKMFVIELTDIETGYADTIWCVAEPKKRWYLKNLLTACGVKAGEDGVYDWDESDILTKKIIGEVIHEPNSYINRNGEEINTVQHKIVSFEEISWDE